MLVFKRFHLPLQILASIEQVVVLRMGLFASLALFIYSELILEQVLSILP